MNATAHLTRDHQGILRVLAEAEQQAARMPWLGQVPARTLRQLVNYFQTAVVRCHQTKEEIYLFAWLQQYDRQTVREPMERLIAEHAESRRLLRQLDRSLTAPGRDQDHTAQSVAQTLQAYVTLLRAHIQRENESLFPLADRLFTPEDQNALAAAFERIELEAIDNAAHDPLQRWPGLAVEGEILLAV